MRRRVVVLASQGSEHMPYTYDFTSDAQPLELEAHYWLNGERLSYAFGVQLPSRMADLLDVTMAVYAADRRSPRDFKKENTGQRGIHIRLAVREPELWASDEISERLRELLSWLSEDVWSFEFVRRESIPSPAESVRFLFPSPTERCAEVSLFSGGLDSLAGLAARALEEPDRCHVLVSGYTNHRLAHHQRVQVRGISVARWPLSRESPRETTRRCAVRHPQARGTPRGEKPARPCPSVPHAWRGGGFASGHGHLTGL